MRDYFVALSKWIFCLCVIDEWWTTIILYINKANTEKELAFNRVRHFFIKIVYVCKCVWCLFVSSLLLYVGFVYLSNLLYVNNNKIDENVKHQFACVVFFFFLLLSESKYRATVKWSSQKRDSGHACFLSFSISLLLTFCLCRAEFVSVFF